MLARDEAGAAGALEGGATWSCDGACGHRWHRWAWLPKNVACNSHVNLSNFEIRPLELQRLWAVLNFRVAELHATLGVWVLARDEAGAAGACGHRWAWLPKNVARNSHVNLSNFETRPLELQRLWVVPNFRVAELRATLGARRGGSEGWVGGARGRWGG